MHLPPARRHLLRLPLRPQDARSLHKEGQRSAGPAAHLRRYPQPGARRAAAGNARDHAYLPRQLQEQLGGGGRLRVGRRSDVQRERRRFFHGVRLGARRRLRAFALPAERQEGGFGFGHYQVRPAGRQGIHKEANKRSRKIHPAGKSLSFTAGRLFGHQSRQPAVAGRAVAQARARGRNRKGGLEMSSEKEILSLEEKRYAAMTASDFGALEALLHDQLLYTPSSAATDTKASWLESLPSGRTRYKTSTT